MSIFNYVNRPGVNDSERTLNPAFVKSLLTMAAMGIYDAEAVRADIVTEAGEALDSVANDDVTSIVSWALEPVAFEGKMARVSAIGAVLDIYEQAQPDGTPWLNESQAQTIRAVMRGDV